MLRARRSKAKGPKRVSYELIDRETVVGHAMYMKLREIVDEYHEDLHDARIALAWCTSWKPDRDGRVTLGKCKKASDLDRELAAYDFIVLLKKTFWNDVLVSDAQRMALLDHELCHAGVTLDERTNDPVYDERGRKVYRLIKHDIEEFIGVVARHGLYKRDLELFGAELMKKARTDLFQPCEVCAESPGWMSVVVDGQPRTRRCACYIAWADKRAEAMAS